VVVDTMGSLEAWHVARRTLARPWLASGAAGADGGAAAYGSRAGDGTSIAIPFTLGPDG